MMVVALFDFCDTLIAGQTIDMFHKYLLKRESFFRRCKLASSMKLHKLAHLTDRLAICRFRLSRFTFFSQKDLDQAVEDFVEQELLPRIKYEILDELISHQNQGYKVVIVSSAYDVYVKNFAKRIGVNCVVATSVRCKDSKMHIVDELCYGLEKVKKLKMVCDFSKIDWDQSTCFTDHESDFPMIELVGNSNIVDPVTTEWIKPNWNVLYTGVRKS